MNLFKKVFSFFLIAISPILFLVIIFSVCSFFSSIKTTVVRKNINNYVNRNYFILESFDYSYDSSHLADEIQKYIRRGLRNSEERINIEIQSKNNAIYFSCGGSSDHLLNRVEWSFVYAIDEEQYISDLLSKGYKQAANNKYEYSPDRYHKYEVEKIRGSFLYCYAYYYW